MFKMLLHPMQVLIFRMNISKLDLEYFFDAAPLKM